MKSFQRALKQRIKNHQQIKPDKYGLEKVIRQVLNVFFGEVGTKAVKFEIRNEKNIFLSSPYSVWRAELKLNKNKFKEAIKKQYPSASEYVIIITE